MKPAFPELKQNFGFGCMRLPMDHDEVDDVEFTKMIDTFLENGFCYFDTAHGYLSGKSEQAIKRCLTSRHPRESYLLTNKLTQPYFHSESDIRPFFEQQLNACGVDYFDFYLMHAVSSENYPHFVNCHAFEIAQQLKNEGKIRRVGMSFHDKAHVLDRILTEHPEIEVVQLQFNYADFDDPVVESDKCYNVCVAHGKPVIVMEPVKGGRLVDLPAEAGALLDQLQNGSYASYALRFCASFPQVCMILSGMGNMDMMRENIRVMSECSPLSDQERETIDRVRDILKTKSLIGCTACRYCVDGCPKHIPIPELFACYNEKKQRPKSDISERYLACTQGGGLPTDCIQCGACERVCPQHLNIIKLLRSTARALMN
ncbi:MAG: aldo/keto reductase [Lachnospiraceae bacterium]